MKKPIQALVRCMALAVFGLGAAALAQPAGSAGAVAFVTDGRTYLGHYSLPDEAVSVEIDGLMYRGHYAARAGDAGALAPGAANTGNVGHTGAWGRAFLFASSAKVLQCQLATGFPQVSGQCQAADGRRFELKARP